MPISCSRGTPVDLDGGLVDVRDLSLRADRDERVERSFDEDRA